jgi:hypothetical protein
VFVVGPLDKGFATGCQAEWDSITANRRRFFDKPRFVGETGIQTGRCLFILPCEACPDRLKVRAGAGD